jgi:hypothetical protein
MGQLHTLRTVLKANRAALFIQASIRDGKGFFDHFDLGSIPAGN